MWDGTFLNVRLQQTILILGQSDYGDVQEQTGLGTITNLIVVS